MRVNRLGLFGLRATLIVGVCLAVLAPALGVSAQTTATGEEFTLEEILVTAQKREELVQDVPIAITVQDGNMLERTKVEDTFDLKVMVPSLEFSTATGGLGHPRIRGVGSTGAGPGIENPVAVYVDGVYMGSLMGALNGLDDVAQVAVLKGPQGTLFGRNATGGVLQITTKRPTQEFTGNVSGTYGNFNTFGGKVYLSGGLSDTVAASVAFKYENRDEGWGVNVFTGNDIMTQESTGARLKLLWTPSDSTEVTLGGDFGQIDAASPAFRPLTTNVRGNLAGGGERDTDADVDPLMESSQYGADLTIMHDFDSVQLVSITAYRKNELRAYFDPDGTTEDEWPPPPAASFPPLGFAHGFIIDNNEYHDQFTQELQLISTYEGPFQWVTGAYYIGSDGEYDPSKSMHAFDAFLGTYGDLTVSQGLDSYAGFVQGTYTINDKTNLTAGFRYTKDERDLSGIRQAVDAETGEPLEDQEAPEGEFQEESQSDTQPTYRLSIDHRFTPEVMGYASYNRGFRSGAFVAQNVGVDPARMIGEPLLQPEIVDAYEVGLKTDLFNRKLRLNVAGYYYEQENVQVMQVQSGVQVIYNAKGAEIYGVDADFQLLATENLLFTGGFNAVDATYTDFPDAVLGIPNMATPWGGEACSVPADGGNCLTTGDASGNNLQNTPDWTANLGVNYDLLTQSGDYNFAVNYYYNGGWSATPDNRVNQDAYNLLNASIQWSNPASGLYINLWGKNLTDDFYFQQLGATNFANNGVQGAPRTYGVTVGVKF